MSLFLGLDLGGTRVRSVVARGDDDPPRILARDERNTPRTGVEDVLAALAASAHAALAMEHLSAADVEAIGCSAPGPLDHMRGLVHEAPNIPGFVEVALAERLARGVGMKVFLDRDTVMAAIAEAMAGAAKGVRDFVYVTISTGIGGAIVSGGRLIRGASNAAGEIGHIPVSFEGPRCGCGSRGCVESLASGRALAEGFGVDDAAAVFAAAEARDPNAVALVRRAEAALENLAVGIANALNPALIVVGGSVAEHEPEHTITPMRRAIRERAFRVAADAVRVVPAALGRDVGMLGAVIAARERSRGRGEWFL